MILKLDNFEINELNSSGLNWFDAHRDVDALNFEDTSLTGFPHSSGFKWMHDDVLKAWYKL